MSDSRKKSSSQISDKYKITENEKEVKEAIDESCCYSIKLLLLEVANATFPGCSLLDANGVSRRDSVMQINLYDKIVDLKFLNVQEVPDQKTHCAFVIFDLFRERSLISDSSNDKYSISHQIQTAKKDVCKGCPIILVGQMKEKDRKIKYDDARKFADSLNLPYIEVDLKDKIRMKELFELAAELVLAKIDPDVKLDALQDDKLSEKAVMLAKKASGIERHTPDAYNFIRECFLNYSKANFGTFAGVVRLMSFQFHAHYGEKVAELLRKPKYVTFNKDTLKHFLEKIKSSIDVKQINPEGDLNAILTVTRKLSGIDFYAVALRETKDQSVLRPNGLLK